MDSHNRDRRHAGSPAPTGTTPSPGLSSDDGSSNVVDSSPQGDSGKTALLFEQGTELAQRGRLDEAVHVWTKILFLDRRNVAAKQAIEVAKSSIAERLRQLDEEVALSKADFDRGDRRSAQARLRSVVQSDPRHQEARLLLGSLEAKTRFESLVREAAAPPVVPAAAPPDRPAPNRPRGADGESGGEASAITMAAFVLVAIVLLAVGGGYLYVSWESLFLDEGFPTRAGADTEPDGFLVSIPTRAELSYYNGVRLFDKGRYREALGELRRVSAGSPQAEAARRLILRIEDRLLRDNPAPTGELAAPSGGS